MTHALRIWATLAFLLFGTLSLPAQNTAAQESRRAALRKEIAQLEKQISENKSKRENALGELKLVRRKVATRRELVAESEREIRALTDSIAARQAPRSKTTTAGWSAPPTRTATRASGSPTCCPPATSGRPPGAMSICATSRAR